MSIRKAMALILLAAEIILLSACATPAAGRPVAVPELPSEGPFLELLVDSPSTVEDVVSNFIVMEHLYVSWKCNCYHLMAYIADLAGDAVAAEDYRARTERLMALLEE